MKRLPLIVCLLIFGFSSTGAHAQSYLEFIENKGQWDKNISFKGDMKAGSFILKPDGGYRMIIHNQKDLAARAAFYHGNFGQASAHTESISTKKASPDNAGTEASQTVHSHAYEIRFLNANPHPVAVPDKILNTYNNYFIGNDKSKWVSGCKVYGAITYKNVYPAIDVRYYTSNGQLKYDIIVNPGGNVEQVAMYFDGVNALKLKEGGLSVQTSVDEVKEMPPYSYVVADAGRQELSSSYELKGNIVRFKVNGAYSKTSTLVIDPQLVFSTFTGSSADNWGYTATYDALGNFYAGGIVFTPGSFPVSNGAYQTKFAGSGRGDFDIGIMKFDPTGSNRIYATYLGGSTGNEQPQSMVVDPAGELIVAGRTNSSDYPGTMFLGVTGGGGGANSWDIILTKFNAAGTALIGSRIFGGSGDDGVNIQDKETRCSGSTSACAISLRRNYGDDARSEVIIDASGNIYLASCTQSANFPVTANAFQNKLSVDTTKSNIRLQDGVLIKTTPDLGTVLLSTYLGGTNDDAAYALALNPLNNNLYVAGGTASADFPGNKAGTINPVYQNHSICEGFVSIISNTNSPQVLTTCYFEKDTVAATNVYGIQFDKLGFPYIMGTTTGGWPVINATFSQKNGKQFIAKLQPDLSAYVYSTVFGTDAAEPNISPIAFLVDRCENVYVSGWGGEGNTGGSYPSSGTTGLSVTPDAIQAATDGSDFYFFVLQKNAQSQLYGSFFGKVGGGYPDHVDGGTSRFDKNGIIYQAMCANCVTTGGSFPTTPGSWSPVDGSVTGAGCNLAAVKIAFNLAGLATGLRATTRNIPGDTSGCVPLAVVFNDTVGLAKKYFWNFGDGSPQQTTTVPTISYTYNFVGTYKVMLVGEDDASCNIFDTSYTTIRVRNDQASLAMNAFKIPPCSSLAFEFDNNSTAPVGKPFQSNSFKLSFGDGGSQLLGSPQNVTHSYAAGGTYIATLLLTDTNYCNAPDSLKQTIRISANVKAQFTTPASGCAPYTAVITNTSAGGQQFAWDFGDGTTSNLPDPGTHFYPNPGNYTIKLVATDTSTCNKVDSTSLTITVSAKPGSSFTYSPNPPQSNTAVDFSNTSSGGISYKWIFGDGDSLVTSSTAIVSHIYPATQTFNTCLVVFNSFGCTDTSCQSVKAIISPIFNVPNAFTPNGDGVNDKIFVRGFGISKMEWQIYNRWGVLVYVSANKDQGWDGTYKGALQPQDVYHYTLSIEFTDKTKFTKTGDITLLR